MRSLRSIAALIPFLAVLSACEERQGVLQPEGSGNYVFSIKASCPEITRSDYDAAGTFSWSEGDAISVLFHKGGENRFFTLSTSGSGPVATFTGTIGAGYSIGSGDDGTKWAFFPAGSHTYASASEISFNIPAVTDYTAEGAHWSADLPLHAQGTESNSFAFKHLGVAFKINIGGIDADKVKVKVENQETSTGALYALSGNVPVEPDGSKYYLNYGYGYTDTRVRTYILEVVDGSASFYVPVRYWAACFKPIITISDAVTDEVIGTYTASNEAPGLTSLGKVQAITISTDKPSEVSTAYTEVSGDVLNPERGFYKGAGDISSASNPVKVSAVKAARAAGRSLMYVGFYLTDFMDGDISQAYLDMIQSSMDAFREGGVKCILRFAYKRSSGSDAKPWDAPKDIVLRHIEQLKPILQKNEDVIFLLQAGFVGVWGEWYYTSNFGMNPSSATDYLPRKAVCDALLDALPASRQIALRTPAFKMNMYGLALADTLTTATAHDGSGKSRLAGHNDCFGASSSDSGTFSSDAERSYWKAESRYTIMGGETCQVSDYCLCEASLKDLEDYHWTYLHDGYRQEVLDRWTQDGCMDEIEQRLGYRLVLEKSTHSGNPAAGEKLKVSVDFINKGYAAPQNPRNAKFVYIDTDGGRTETDLGSDPRTWHPGKHTVSAELSLPAKKGTLYIELSDPLLSGRPEYSIAFANEGVYDSSTGLNKLFDI